jgi:hemerythrin
MPLIPWNPKFETGIEPIDAQHRQLVETLNTLHEAMLKGQGKKKVAEILAFLNGYIQDHFSLEEGIMASNRYSDLESHRHGHADMKAQVQEIVDQFGTGSGAATLSLIELLDDYLVRHIVEDLHFAKELREKTL